MDTIHYFVHRTRYYLFTAIDHHSRFAIAITSRRANNKTAAAFAQLETVFPANIKQVLTDNGSEFEGDLPSFRTKVTPIARPEQSAVLLILVALK